MPSLKSLRRSARGIVGEKVRGVTGAGEGQDSEYGSGITSPEPSDVRERPRQDSTKRAFLRELITASKAKLGSRRAPDTTNDGDSSDDASNSSSSGSGSSGGGGSDRSGHDAEKATNATVSTYLSETFSY